jgi:hypothetical protein
VTPELDGQAIHELVELFFRGERVGFVSSVFLDYPHWFGEFGVAFDMKDAKAAAEVERFIAALREWTQRQTLANEGRGPLPEEEELDAFKELFESREWHVRRKDGSSVRLEGAPWFGPGTLIAWDEEP